MDLDTTTKHCSFCGEVGDDEIGLFGGLGAFICGECIDVAADVVAEQRGTAVDRPLPWTRMSDVELLSQLWSIDRTVMQAEQFLAEWARMIRARGVSWAEIGKALAIPARDARARFGSVGVRA